MLKKIVEYSKKKPHYILLGLFVVSGFTYFLIFSLVGTSHTKNSHAQTSSTVVYVPAPATACPTSGADSTNDAKAISNWINNTANVPNGTPGDPTIVKFAAPCYDIEGTIFFNGGASVPFKDGDCAAHGENDNENVGNCKYLRHDIVFDGTGTQFIFFTNGSRFGISAGEDYFGTNGYGFSYEDMKWYILGGDDLTFQNINMQGPAWMGESYFVSCDGASGMEISGAENVIVQDNTFNHTCSDFITMLGYHPLGGDMNAAPDTNITIQNNTFSNAGRQGISPDDVNGVLIQHNSIDNVSDVDYDLETDTPAEVINNVTINDNIVRGGSAAWLEDNAGTGGPNGPAGSSSNILVENDNVGYALHVINATGKCKDKPLNGFKIINNTAADNWDNGYQPLMMLSCVTNLDVENNHSGVVSFFHNNVFDLGSDDYVTIKNNTFPKANQPRTSAKQNPALVLISSGSTPTHLVDCGNNLQSKGLLGPLADGSCNAPPPPVCPGGETGTPPNCTKPVQHQTQPSGSKTGGSSTTSKTSSSTPSTTKSSSSTSVANTTTANTGSASTASNPISKPVSTLGPPAGVNLSLISKVEYLVDNKLVATSSASPFTAKLDTDKFTNGCHVEQIIVFYKTGKTSASNQPLCVKHGASSGNSDYLFWLIPAAILLALGGAYTYYRHQLPTWLKPKKDKKKPSSGPKIIVGKM